MLSVIVPAWGPVGNAYSRYVARWWAAVEAMTPGPAEVVVVHSSPEPLGLLASAPPGLPVRSVQIASDRIEDHVNAGVEAASQPWVSAIGVDDVYRRDALADLVVADGLGAEIMVWDQEEFGSHVWRCFWSPKVLQTANTIAGSCPFRRDLWRRVGGQPRLGWSDWGFWLRCASAGARAWHCHRIGVVFDPGHDHETWSGSRLPMSDRLARDAEALAFARSLAP